MQEPFQTHEEEEAGARMQKHSTFFLNTHFRHTKTILGVFLVLCLIGCAGRFNPESHRNIAALKQSHLQFIHEFTEEEGKTWDVQTFDKESLQMDVEFQKALSHSEKLSDKMRTSSIQVLQKTFHDDKELLQQTNRMLNPIESEELLGTAVQVYNLALETECIRRGGPGAGEACIPSNTPERGQ